MLTCVSDSEPRALRRVRERLCPDVTRPVADMVTVPRPRARAATSCRSLVAVLTAVLVLSSLSLDADQRGKVPTVPSAKQSRQQFTAGDVYKAFEEQRVVRVYLATEEFAIHAEYLRAKNGEPVLFVQGLRNPVGKENYHQLEVNHPRLKSRFETAVDDDLLMRLCGSRMGDDSCDYFSPVGRSTTTGAEISDADRALCRAIVQAVGEALTQSRARRGHR
jgi:hypothetical protein